MSLKSGGVGTFILQFAKGCFVGKISFNGFSDNSEKNFGVHFEEVRMH